MSFLLHYCHSQLLSFLPNIVIPSGLFRELQILTSSKSFPCPKGEKNGHQRRPYMRVAYKTYNWAVQRSHFLESRVLPQVPDETKTCAWSILQFAWIRNRTLGIQILNSLLDQRSFDKLNFKRYGFRNGFIRKKIHKMKPTDYISKGTFYSEGVGEISNRHSN